MSEPQITGYHHLGLTVSDVARSAAWWRELLGLELVRQYEQNGMTKVILRHPGSGAILSLTGHGTRASGDRFSEFRTGMDHVAFTVAGRAELEAWSRRFEELGVEHSEIKSSVTGELITARDPDHIQFEVFAPAPPTA